MNFGVVLGEQRNFQQLLDRNEAGANPVLDVVIVVRDLVGEVRELCLEPRLLAIDEPLADVAELERVLLRAMFEDALTALEAQIQSVEIGVSLLELVDDAQRLQIVLESAEIQHAFVERILPGMAEGRMTEIVRETDGFRQHLVESQRLGDGPRDLRDLERMREACSIQIAFVIDEHLGLVDQAAKCRAVHDPIAVALIFRSVGGRRFRMATSTRLRVVSRKWRQIAHSKYSASVASSASCA